LCIYQKEKMKLQHCLDKLNKSSEYKEFKSKYKDAFMIAGFFILDLEKGINVHQLDFYLPKEKKVAAFNLDKSVQVQILEAMNQKLPAELDLKTKIDLDTLPGVVEDEMKNRNITEEIRKIIAILQNLDGKKVWNLSCVLSGMGILKAHVDDESETILKMEKLSILDLIKKVPTSQLSGLNQKGISSKEELEQEIKKLDNVESQIEKQKEKIKQELKSKEKESKTKAKK